MFLGALNRAPLEQLGFTANADAGPVCVCSVLCYSSDRQLSLDLVNVGRQRLDFLPMLEHSGTYHETPTHTGTFAQEIITLVHHVKGRLQVKGGAFVAQSPCCKGAGVCLQSATSEEGGSPWTSVSQRHGRLGSLKSKKQKS